MSTSNPSRRLRRFLTTLLLTLPSLSCFEQPVTESIEIRLLPRNAAMVRVTVKLADPESFKDSPSAQKRVEEARRDLLEGRDPWTKRLESLEPGFERTTLDRIEGGLSRVEHRVLFEDPERLKRFFSDTLIQVTLVRGEEESELSLAPEPGSRATRAQQERMDRDLGDWTSDLSRYLEAGGRLYSYLDQNPGRSRACFEKIFQDLLSEEAKENQEELSPDDSALVKPFQEAMQEVLGLFHVPEDSAYSLEELSRLVYDPFPAPMVVRVPGPVLESEGFERGAPGVLRVTGLSLWEALAQVQDRWISPDPLTVYYEHLRESKQTLDLEEFLRRPRSASPPPAPQEILRVLEEHLRAAPLYRVRWSTRDLPELEESSDVWDSPALQ